MKKLKKGDSIIVIAGKDKGKKGEILRVIEPDRKGNAYSYIQCDDVESNI